MRSACLPTSLREGDREDCTHLLHLGKHREISLFIESCRQKSKFGFFITEEESFRRIAEELGMEKQNDAPLKYARHPLVYLVEAADDICYQMMDIEDAHKLKF